MSEKRYYTGKELQEILGVSRPTIYNLLKKNEFRWIQLDGGAVCALWRSQMRFSTAAMRSRTAARI